MAIEIIPKPAAKLPFWQNALFYFSIAILLLSVFTYFILDFFIQKAEDTSQALEETLTQQKTPQQKSLETKVLGYREKIGDFESLINSHAYSSKFFEFFQRLSHPQIWFSTITLNLKNHDLMIEGLSDSFSVVGQQLIIFQQENLIKKVNLSNLSIGKEGKVEFTFNLSFDSVVVK